MTVQEGNKIIAEFMGWRFDMEPNEFGGELLAYHDEILSWSGEKPEYLDKILLSEHGFSFHLKWDKLMPVIEKIYLLREVEAVILEPGSACIIAKNACKFKSPNAPENTWVKEIWLVVTSFITWYNSQNL